MSDPLELVPGYVSPLTDEQHAQVGRIAILWGQIEHFVEQLLPQVTGLTWGELEALQVTEKAINSKALFLKAAAKRIEDGGVRKEIQQFCAAIEDTKTHRNHIFHGIWGWRGDKRSKRIFPAARKTSVPHDPFKASKLPDLEKRLCRCSRLGFDLMVHFDSPGSRIKYSRFLHHGDKEPIPEWFQQWSKRNPLDSVALDQTATKGQLQRLSEPYPQK